MTLDEFNQFQFNSTIQQVINQLHFTKPTTIQKRAIPDILQGKSVIGQSYTGSGKTHAYLLPLFHRIKAEKQEVQFIITAPTRELSRQLYREVRKIIDLAKKEKIWYAQLLIGGTEKQIKDEGKQTPHIIVGTPGRILDLVNDGVLSIYTATTFVIDEADLMLDLGFIKEIDQLLVRSQDDVQILAFSATIPKRLQRFFNKYLRNPAYVHVDDQLFPETLEHRLIALRNRNPSQLIVELSQVFQPYLALIFTNGKESANELAESLQAAGLSVGLLHGDKTPRERRRTLNDIQNLRYQYIVATDLASRGIDIEGVSHVINVDLPKEEHFYIHRVGRTARAGLTGMAISFYDDEDIPLIQKFEEQGVEFQYVDVRNRDWVEAPKWNRRANRQRQVNKESKIDQEAWKRVKKPKEVKPGYRKKMKRQQEKIKKQLKSKGSHRKRK